MPPAIVDEHGIGFDIRRDPVEEDDRSAARQQPGNVVGGSVADRRDNETVDASLLEDPHRGPLEGQVLVTVGDDDLQPSIMCHIGSTTECLGKNTLPIGCHKRQGMGAAGDHAAGKSVAPIAQAGRSGVNPRSRLSADRTVGAECSRSR